MGRRGNKPDFSSDVYDQILERMAQGESLSAICRDRDMPSRVTVLRQVTSDPAFEALYDRARQAMGDALAEDCLRIADDASNDLSDPQSVNRAKLKVDTRKWLASKLFPRQFGDVVRNEVSGPAGGPIQQVFQVEDSTPSIRALLMAAIGDTKAIEGEAEDVTSEASPKDRGERPRLG